MWSLLIDRLKDKTLISCCSISQWPQRLRLLCALHFTIRDTRVVFFLFSTTSPDITNNFLEENLCLLYTNNYPQKSPKDDATTSFHDSWPYVLLLSESTEKDISVYNTLAVNETLTVTPQSPPPPGALSPLHSLSSAWPGETAAGGGASRALSGQAAVHSPDTPGMRERKGTIIRRI